jgi:hypothetical protein
MSIKIRVRYSVDCDINGCTTTQKDPIYEYNC